MFLHLDGRVHGGMQFGVLVLVVFWDAVCDARVLSGMRWRCRHIFPS